MNCHTTSLQNNFLFQKSNERGDDMDLKVTKKSSNTGKNILLNTQSIQKVKIKKNMGFQLGKSGFSGKIVHGKEIKYQR